MTIPPQRVIPLFCFMLVFFWFIVGTRNQLALLTTEKIDLPSQQKNLAVQQDILSVMLQQLPDKTELPQFLDDLSKMAVNIGLDVKLFKPLPENPSEFYSELPIHITLVGSYHKLALFISQFSTLKYIVTVHDFILEADEKNSEQLIMHLTAKTYRYTEKKPPLPNLLPHIQQPKKFFYSADPLRSPFSPFLSKKPNPQTVEPLALFPLSALKMVGTFTVFDTKWALITAPNQITYKITIGNRIGQTNGRVTEINEKRVQISDGRQISSLPLQQVNSTP
ncbi:MAG: pilus assembly protein PilP [Gammaproteobacteria bacterium]